MRWKGSCARRLIVGGHEVVAWDRSAEAVAAAANDGAGGAASIDALVGGLHKVREVFG